MKKKNIIILICVFLSTCFYNSYIDKNYSYDAMRISRSVLEDDFLNFIESTANRVRYEIEISPYYIRTRGGHLNHSRNMSLEVAELSLIEQEGNSTKRALVMGAGNCLDTPLKELVGMFDEVYLQGLAYKTICDIKETGHYYELINTKDGWQVQEGILSVEERSRIKLVDPPADITGGASLEMARRTQDLVNKSSRINEDDVLAITEGIVLNQLPFEDGYFDFISSSTVLSGLISKVEGYMKSRLHNVGAAFYVNNHDIQKALEELSRRVEGHHMAESNRILKQNGRFYLSASVSIHETYQSGIIGNKKDFLNEGKGIADSFKGISVPRDLKELASDDFHIEPEEQNFINSWFWPIGTDRNGIDRAIFVQAVILSKPESAVYENEVLSDIEVYPSLALLETIEEIHIFNSPTADAIRQAILALPDHIINDRRLRGFMMDEFKDDDIEFKDDFKPYLYATSLGVLNRADLRRIFIGGGEVGVQNVTLGGKVVLTRLVRIANDTYINGVTFHAANYIGRSWHIEHTSHISRSVFSDGVTENDGILTTNLTNTKVVQSYVGAGSTIKARVLEKTVVPEGRIIGEGIEVIGLMNEEVVLAGYIKDFSVDLDLISLFNEILEYKIII